MVKAMAEIGDIETTLKDLQAELERTQRDGITPNPEFAVPDETKLKLRLKLSDQASSTLSSPPSFQITLSSGSQFCSIPAQMKKKRAREDLDFVNANGDDEWKPNKVASATTIAPSKTKKKLNPKTAPEPKLKKTASARERLLKRLR
jgi:hypothetical protein